MMGDKLHMDAYYYGFEPTGNPAIDLILSAVAVAGKAEHSTMCWTDEITDYPRANPFTGGSPVEWIQNSADDAAKDVTDLVEALRQLVSDVDGLIVESDGIYGLHLNGDHALWSDLTDGGCLEGWLSGLEKARAALAAYEEKQNEST